METNDIVGDQGPQTPLTLQKTSKTTIPVKPFLRFRWTTQTESLTQKIYQHEWQNFTIERDI